jgi:hypothetical protein
MLSGDAHARPVDHAWITRRSHDWWRRGRRPTPDMGSDNTMGVNHRRDRRCAGRRLRAIVYGRGAARGGLDCRGIGRFGLSGCYQERGAASGSLTEAATGSLPSPVLPANRRIAAGIARPSARGSLSVPAALMPRARICREQCTRPCPSKRVPAVNSDRRRSLRSAFVALSESSPPDQVIFAARLNSPSSHPRPSGALSGLHVKVFTA